MTIEEKKPYLAPNVVTEPYQPPYFFKAWQNEPKVSLHDETSVQSVLKVPLQPEHEGKVFRCVLDGTEKAFLIVGVSPNVHLPEMVGEDKTTGPYRVVSAREV